MAITMFACGIRFEELFRAYRFWFANMKPTMWKFSGWLRVFVWSKITMAWWTNDFPCADELTWLTEVRPWRTVEVFGSWRTHLAPEQGAQGPWFSSQLVDRKWQLLLKLDNLLGWWVDPVGLILASYPPRGITIVEENDRGLGLGRLGTTNQWLMYASSICNCNEP